MSKMLKKLALVFTLVFVFAALPFSAFAAQTATEVSTAAELKTVLEAGGYAKLTADIFPEDNQNIVITGNVEARLDLNGHVIRYESKNTALFTVNSGAKLTVEDNTTTDKVFQGIIDTDYVAVRLGINGDSTKGGTYVMNGGQIFAGTAGVLYFGGCTIEINNGIIQAVDRTPNGGNPAWYGLCGNGSAGNDGTVITLNDGLISAETGIYQPNTATTYLKGGQVTGEQDSAVEIRAGYLEADGVILSCWGEPAVGESNANGTSVVGACIAVSQHTTDLPIQVVVNSSNCGVGWAEKGCPIFLNKCEDNKDNTSPISIQANWEVYTNDIEYAVGKVNGALVVPSEDLTVDNIITIGEDFTLDLRGRSITAPQGNAIEVVDGRLHIFDSVGGGKISAPNGQAIRVGANVNTGDKTAHPGSLVLSRVDYTGNNSIFTVEGQYGITVWAGSEANINGVTVKGTQAAISGNGDNHNTTITLNDYAVVESDDTGIYHPQNGNLFVSNTKVTGLTGIEMRAGTLTAENAEVTATGSFSATGNGSGTTVTGAAVVVSQHTTNHNTRAYINSGTYTGEYAVYEADLEDGGSVPVEITLNGGTFEGKIASSDVVNNFIYGGRYKEKPADEDVRSGYSAVKDGDYYVITDMYSEALPKASNGVITLDKNVKLSQTVVIGAGEDVTIDLNGYYITHKGLAEGNKSAFVVKEGGKLTVKDFRDGGLIAAEYAAVILGVNGDNTKGGTFVLEKGNLYGGAAGILFFGGNTVTINGGEVVGSPFEQEGKYPGYYGMAGNGSAGNDGTIVTINGGMINGRTGIYQPNAGTTNLNGGTIFGNAESGIEIRAGKFNTNGGEVCCGAEPTTGGSNTSGTTVTGAAVAVSQHTTDLPIEVNINSDTTGVGFAPGGVAVFLNYSEDNKNNTSPVTIKTSWGVHTNNLQYAIGKVIGTPIFLTENQNVDTMITINKDTDIDLNGHSIIAAEGNAMEIVDARVIINDSVGGGRIMAPKGQAIRVGRNVNTGDKTAHPAQLTLCKSIDNFGNATRFDVKGQYGITVWAGSRLDVDGINVMGTEAAISGNGDNHDTSIGVGGGATIDGGSVGIYHPQRGNLDIMDAMVTANTAVEIRSGHVTVQENAVLNAMGSFSATPNGSGTTVTGAALAISQHTTNQEIFVHIMDGIFNGPRAIYETDVQDGKSVPVGMQIDKGYFNGKVETTEYVDGFIFGGHFREEPAAEDLAHGFGAEHDGEYFVVTENVAKLRAPELTVSNIASTGKIQLKWTKVEGADRYEVFRATSADGEYTLLKAVTGTSLKHTTANAGETYFYKVMAICDADGRANSDYSEVHGITVDLPQPVLKATNVTTTGKIKLSWNQISGAVKYEVYRSTTGEEGSYVKSTEITGTSVTFISAKAGVQYYYKVVAVHRNTEANSAAAVVSRMCNLERPTITVANVTSTGKIKISWNAVEGASKYEVYRSTSKNGTYTLLKTVTGTSLTNTSTTAGTTYYYKVRALHTNGIANSDYSAIASRTCDLARPTVTLSNVASTGKIKISWNAVEGASKYEVYRSTSKNGTYTLLKTVTGTSLTNTSTTAGTTYYYKVKAIHTNSDANSAYSTIAYRTCDLARPTVTLKLNTSGKPVISWNKVDGAVKYKVYRSTSKNGTYTLLKTVTGTSLTNTSTTAGKTYYYKVYAVHTTSAANSAYSAVKSITSK